MNEKLVADLLSITCSSISGLNLVGKTGKSILQPAIADALQSAGFEVDKEDCGQFLKSRMPVWRSKDTGQIVPTFGRRKIDVVVYQEGKPVALIETESDLNDLRSEGVTSRRGHYDVFSIGRSSVGSFFHSYNSLERMASAAYFNHLGKSNNQYPSPEFAAETLSALNSNSPRDHNPDNLALILVTGSTRTIDKRVLQPRLDSLGAYLISARSPR